MKLTPRQEIGRLSIEYITLKKIAEKELDPIRKRNRLLTVKKKLSDLKLLIRAYDSSPKAL
jgi:hypothetical protein